MKETRIGEELTPVHGIDMRKNIAELIAVCVANDTVKFEAGLTCQGKRIRVEFRIVDVKVITNN